jgi:hypothetical protein
MSGINRYTGTFYKGNASNIGAHQYRLRQNSIVPEKSKLSYYLLLAIPIIFILLFFYFNRRACNKQKENNTNTQSKAERTIDMIEKMANYNLKSDMNEIDQENVIKHQKMLDDFKRHEIMANQVREKQALTKVKSLEEGQIFPYDNCNRDINKLPNMQFELQQPLHQINSPIVMPGEPEREVSQYIPGAFNDMDFMSDLPPMILQNNEIEQNIPYNSPYQYKDPNMMCNNNDYMNGESLSEIIRAYQPNDHTLANEW